MKIIKLSSLRGLLLILGFIFFSLQLVISSTPLAVIINAISIMLFVLAIIGASKFYLVLSGFFITGSISIAITYKLAWLETALGFSSMLKMILFLGLIPLIAIPIQGYMEQLQRLVQLVNRRISSFQACNITSFILAIFINLASLPICKSIFYNNGQKKEEQLIYSLLIIRSFGIAMIISPIGAAIALAMDMTGANFKSLIATNLTLAIIGLVLSYRLALGGKAQTTTGYQEEIRLKKKNFTFLIYLVVPFSIYFISLLWINAWFALGIMESIILTILPFTFLWNLSLKRVNEWWNSFRTQLLVRTSNFFGQFSVIISAGLFINTMKLSGIDKLIIEILPGTGTSFSGMIFIPVTILMILFMALVGVHQFVALAFVGELLDPVLLGIDHSVFASTLLVGFVAGMLSSSFSGTNLLMSNLSPLATSSGYARMNYTFTLIFIGISTVLLIAINYLLV